MIPKNIKRERVIKAREEIKRKRNRTPKGRNSRKFLLHQLFQSQKPRTKFIFGFNSGRDRELT